MVIDALEESFGKHVDADNSRQLVKGAFQRDLSGRRCPLPRRRYWLMSCS
jgi:hypothetical protein